jgi:hypothetical protein
MAVRGDTIRDLDEQASERRVTRYLARLLSSCAGVIRSNLVEDGMGRDGPDTKLGTTVAINVRAGVVRAGR